MWHDAPPNGPLLLVWIERAQRGGTIGAGGQIDRIVVDVAEASEDLPYRGRTLEVEPFVVGGKSLLEASMHHAPTAYEEVKVANAG